MADEPLAAQAMQRIQDHIDACSHNYVAMRDMFDDLKGAIANTNKLLLGFISGVVAVVVTFAGYTYVEQQTVASQLAESRSQTADAIAQIPAKTARAISATNTTSTGN